MLNKFLGRTEGHQAQGASWRDAAPNAEKTEPSTPANFLASVVKKLPLDLSAKSAKRANDRVVVAEGDVERARIALEQIIKENAEKEALHRGYLAKREGELDRATADLVKAQMHFINEAREQGALERTGPLMAFLGRATDEEIVPTVRLEIE